MEPHLRPSLLRSLLFFFWFLLSWKTSRPLPRLGRRHRRPRNQSMDSYPGEGRVDTTVVQRDLKRRNTISTSETPFFSSSSRSHNHILPFDSDLEGQRSVSGTPRGRLAVQGSLVSRRLSQVLLDLLVGRTLVRTDLRIKSTTVPWK